MIRLIFVGDQVTDGDAEFAFWSTREDRFIAISGEQMWSSVEDLREAQATCVADPVLQQFINDRLLPMAIADDRIARTEADRSARHAAKEDVTP